MQAPRVTELTWTREWLLRSFRGEEEFKQLTH
jgi:hypothetical protein